MRLLGASGMSTARRPSQDVIDNLLWYLREGGELQARIGLFAETTMDRLRRLIVSGVQMGKSPREIARWIVEQGFGMGLTDAMRMMRTVQLWSYREATRAGYLANADVVRGWVWMSALIPGRTCMACVAMHGTIHGLDEVLNDHHNGLCAMLPLVGENPLAVPGPDWFRKLPKRDQVEMMGPGKYAAWKAGVFEIEDMAGEVENDVYGLMRVERSLKELTQ